MQLNIPHLEVCSNCHGQGYIESPGVCPECHGKGQITQKSGSMKFNVPVPALRRQRQEPHRVPGLPWRRPRGAQRVAGSAHQAGHARRPAHSPSGPRQCRNHGRARGRSLHHRARGRASGVQARGRRHLSHRAGRRVSEAALGGKIEVPTIDGRALLKIPPGTQCGQKLRLREKGVPRRSRKGSAATRSSRSRWSRRRSRDERSKEILRELAKLNPEDPREELWKDSN